MIHRRVAAVSSSSPSIAVPGPHVSRGAGGCGLHPGGFSSPGWLKPSSTLPAPELSRRVERSPGLAAAAGEGARRVPGPGQGSGTDGQMSHSCLSPCAGL